ncbi:MAG: hypothetical protein H6732_14110 [Alphaproteobacteria bacterium]|nr:hypothetical protein [Alphaproteobacteria bacterium]
MSDVGEQRDARTRRRLGLGGLVLVGLLVAVGLFVSWRAAEDLPPPPVPAARAASAVPAVEVVAPGAAPVVIAPSPPPQPPSVPQPVPSQHALAAPPPAPGRVRCAVAPPFPRPRTVMAMAAALSPETLPSQGGVPDIVGPVPVQLGGAHVDLPVHDDAPRTQVLFLSEDVIVEGLFHIAPTGCDAPLHIRDAEVVTGRVEPDGEGRPTLVRGCGSAALVKEDGSFELAVPRGEDCAVRAVLLEPEGDRASDTAEGASTPVEVDPPRSP